MEPCQTMQETLASDSLQPQSMEKKTTSDQHPIRIIKPIISNNKEHFLNLHLLKRYFKRKERTTSYRFNETSRENHKMTLKDTFNALSEAMKSSKRTQKLHIQNPTVHESSSGAEYICEIVKGKRSLKDLALNLSGQHPIFEEDLKRFVKGFKSLASLESLCFQIENLNSITDSGTKALCSALKSQKYLKRITIGLKSNVMGVILKNLVKALKTLVLLESMTLKFLRAEEDVCLNVLCLGQIFHFLPCLKSLHLDFGVLAELEVQGLIKGLRDLSGLKDLVLNLKGCDRLNGGAVRSMAESLQNLIALQSLSLNLSCRSLVQWEISSLWQGIQNLTSLKHIELGFSSWTNNDELEGLGQALNNLPLLRSINMSFEYSFFGGVGMEYLMAGLSSLTSLRILSLNFARTEIIYDIETLGNGLRKLTSLETLHIDFSRLPTYGHRFKLSTIGQDVKSLPSLKSISMIFKGWNVSRAEKNSLKRVLQAMDSKPSVFIE